ncbi:PqqD family protein [Candidatus Desantisbacteria bacterium]|nr:PqqD family protein [Candidatus Desantisbacteria bacterium]
MAGKIWLLCDGNHTEEDIVSELLKIFDVEEAKLRQDINEFISKLIHDGWLYYV